MYPDKATVTKLRLRLANIKQRCTNPKHPSYHRYGGRGIDFRLTIDDIISTWNRDNAHDLQHPSVDRIDNDGHYEPGNIRWLELCQNAAHDPAYRTGGKRRIFIIPDDLWERVRKQAKAEKISMTALIRRTLETARELDEATSGH